MIARLSGTLVEKRPGSAVVDVGGVGYQVSIPLSTYDALGEIGARVELHVHTHVREDALALFGFHTRGDRDLFMRLLAVNGIGPRTALAVHCLVVQDTDRESKQAGWLPALPGRHEDA